jgi:hypothetical protein
MVIKSKKVAKKNKEVEPIEVEPVEEIEVVKVEEMVEEPKTAKVYQVPETKEDYLNLIQCLKDTGATDVSSLEVKASRL